jgi:hypothetical protein
MVVALPYLRAPLYRFPEPDRFSGTSFLNPYANVNGTWQRANLHAHGRPWGGFTNGRQSGHEIARAYRSMGYSVTGVSDYHSIAAFDGVPTLPIYEHGYNLAKRHQLAIGARRVDWFDLPLWQSLSHQQFVIDRLAATAALVALAHPPSRNAYAPDDLRRLSGYHLLEIVNGPHLSEETWDAALSSGHLVWALANDDTHDLKDPARTAIAWNMIDAPSASDSDIIDALRAGRAYAVTRTNEIASAVDTVVDRVEFSDGTLVVSCAGDPSTFLFVGQNGIVRSTVEDALSASYTFAADDSYIRAVIRSPRTAMYLNPIVRDDGSPAAAAPTVDMARTWLMRGSLAIAGAAALFLMRRERRIHASAPATRLRRGVGTGDLRRSRTVPHARRGPGSPADLDLRRRAAAGPANR